MTKTEYATAVIKTAIHNGMTLEQLQTADLDDLMQGYLNAQLNVIKTSARQLVEAGRCTKCQGLKAACEC